MQLTDKQREIVKKFVFNQQLNNMFGCGMEEEYVMNGLPQWKGINHMTDDELLAESGVMSEDIPEFLKRVDNNTLDQW